MPYCYTKVRPQITTNSKLSQLLCEQDNETKNHLSFTHSNCSLPGHPVTNRRRKEETNSMCSSKSCAPCCRARAIRARWTSPPYCRGLLTFCRNRKVGAFILVYMWHGFLVFQRFIFKKLNSTIFFRHHCTEQHLRCEAGLEAFISQ